jgi:hypothetical protein
LFLLVYVHLFAALVPNVQSAKAQSFHPILHYDVRPTLGVLEHKETSLSGCDICVALSCVEPRTAVWTSLMHPMPFCLARNGQQIAAYSSWQEMGA